MAHGEVPVNDTPEELQPIFNLMKEQGGGGGYVAIGMEKQVGYPNKDICLHGCGVILDMLVSCDPSLRIHCQQESSNLPPLYSSMSGYPETAVVLFQYLWITNRMSLRFKPSGKTPQKRKNPRKDDEFSENKPFTGPEMLYGVQY